MKHKFFTDIFKKNMFSRKIPLPQPPTACLLIHRLNIDLLLLMTIFLSLCFSFFVNKWEINVFLS